MTFIAVTPPEIVSAFNEYQSYRYDQVTLYVPMESLEAYRAHEEWGKFSHIVPFIGAGPGDVNGDGKIAISDVTNLINLLLSSDELPAYADVNNDGVVSIQDITALINKILTGDI